MEKEEYWDSFFASGKVEDYLNYCRAEKTEDIRKSKSGNANAKPDGEPEDKVKYNAGFY